MAKGILLPAFWVVGALFGSQAMGMSSSIVGVINTVDVRGRTISLRGGMTFKVAPGVKLSTRREGEEVTVVYQVASNGLVAHEVRPAPIAQKTLLMQDAMQPEGRQSR
jgi:hypothetical protein